MFCYMNVHSLYVEYGTEKINSKQNESIKPAIPIKNPTVYKQLPLISQHQTILQ